MRFSGIETERGDELSELSMANWMNRNVHNR